MAFVCPECKFNSLVIAASLELPPDSMDDEITLQVVSCDGCGLAAVAVYRESRHGALDSESFEHIGYRVSEKNLQTVTDAIQRCPSPFSSDCRCPDHRSFGRTDGYRWDRLGSCGIKLDNQFPMEWTSC